MSTATYFRVGVLFFSLYCFRGSHFPRARTNVLKAVPIKPKRKSRVETEAKIFESSRKIFAKYGFDTATLKQIAAHAGVNEALIIRYFGSKAQLLTAIMNDYLRMQKEASENLPSSESLEEEIRAHLFHQIAFDYENIDFIRIVPSRASVDDKFCKDLIKIFGENGDPELNKRLQRFQDKGVISKETDINAVCHMIQLHSCSYGMELSYNKKLDRSRVEKSATMFASIFAKGLQANQRAEKK
jgi:AcrR family transcriptional regulator